MHSQQLLQQFLELFEGNGTVGVRISLLHEILQQVDADHLVVAHYLVQLTQTNVLVLVLVEHTEHLLDVGLHDERGRVNGALQKLAEGHGLLAQHALQPSNGLLRVLRRPDPHKPRLELNPGQASVVIGIQRLEHLEQLSDLLRRCEHGNHVNPDNLLELRTDSEPSNVFEGLGQGANVDLLAGEFEEPRVVQAVPRGVPVRLLWLQHLDDEVLNLSRSLSKALVIEVKLALNDPQHGLLVTPSNERQPPGDHQVQDDPAGPNVCLVVSLLHQQLWSQKRYSPHHVFAHSYLGVVFKEPEVGDLDAALGQSGCKQDAFRLEGAVENILFVAILQRPKDLQHELSSSELTERSVLDHLVEQLSSRAELRDDEVF